MEDYLQAYIERVLDKSELDGRARHVATAHLGGIALECFLKAWVVQSRGISVWHDPRRGVYQPHRIENPGHELFRAIQSVPELNARFSELLRLGHTEVRDALNYVQRPGKAGYITLRYEGKCSFDYARWKRAFDILHRWLVESYNQITAKS